MRGLLVSIAVGLALAVGGWLLWSAVVANRADAALRTAQARIQQGDFADALRLLEGLGDSDREKPEVLVALGSCYQGLNRLDEAMEAWGRIAPGTPAAREVAPRVLRMARETGRWSMARKVAPTDVVTEGAVEDLLFLLRAQGRLREARDLVRSSVAWSSDPARALGLLWAIESDAFPVAGVEAAVASAEAKSGDDPDIALARAHLAVQRGDLGGADALLRACLAKRPGDVATWVVEAQRARAANDKAALARALEAIPADALDEATWISDHARLVRGDDAAERAVWHELLSIEPTHPAALERLAELEREDSETYRQRKQERDRAQRAFEGLLAGDDPAASAFELGGLSGALGRWFDARGWLNIAARRQPGDARVIAALRAADGQGRRSDDLIAAARDRALRAWNAEATGLEARGESNTEARVPEFVDASQASGLMFRSDNGASAEKQLPETMAGGVALFDFDNDGWLDVYAVQGGVFPAPAGARNADVLFRNKRDGTFKDVSEEVGLRDFAGGFGHGVAIGDVNNDGYGDIFITRFGSYALYVNEGGARFTDATEAWGLGGGRDWPTSAAFADLDGDGDLDLYVCHYVAWDVANPRICRIPASGAVTYCAPAALAARPDRLYRNDGGRFTDISKEAGITEADTDGRGLGVAAGDWDEDGLVDLFVANDTTSNFFFKNMGDMRFEERALAAGLSANATGGYLAGMGIAHGDLDGDGAIDLGVTNFHGECTTFYKRLAAGLFADRTAEIGLGAATRDRLGFGLVFADMNNDGFVDVVQANGHVDDYAPAYPYAMPAQLLLGTLRGRLVAVAGGDSVWGVARVGRGLAVGDMNNDGALDVVIVDQAGPLAYLRNETGGAGGHFLVFGLRGGKSNRDGVGAEVRVKAGDRTWVVGRVGGGSYQSSSDPRLHVGLGDRAAVEVVEVRWPSGTVRQYHELRLDRAYLLSEDESAAAPLAGFEAAKP